VLVPPTSRGRNSNARRASADPGFPHDCFAGCEAKHQQTAFAKKKSHDAMFFVKTARRASADPGFPHDCFAGCEAKHQQTAFAKKKSHDAMFFVKTARRASADPGSSVAASFQLVRVPGPDSTSSKLVATGRTPSPTWGHVFNVSVRLSL